MKNEYKTTKKLSEDDVISLTRNSKIVSLRWDLIDWGLVLDLDVQISEVSQTIYRAWLVFDGISDMDIPFNNVRLPNGCFLTSYIDIQQSVKGFKNYSFSALLPSFDDSGQPLTPVTKSIIISAKEIYGVSSLKTAIVDEFGFLDRKLRLGLATDEAMLLELGSALK